MSVLSYESAFVLNSTYFHQVECSTLKFGQYICPDPDYDPIDPTTQQMRGCQEEYVARVFCTAAPGILCTETDSRIFLKAMPCSWTNGYSWETALLLSIFFGMFGLDRFYLGHYGIGFIKLCTFGFFFVGQLCDIILIATGVLRPADGSAYVMSYYGPGVTIVKCDNMTFRSPQPDW